MMTYTKLITKETATQFAQEWEASWNSHDIGRIISHYAEDIVLISPIAYALLGEAEVHGIESVKRYFLRGLQAYPNLKFEILDVLFGVGSVVLYYNNQNGIKAGEFMQLNREGKVFRMYAHYGE